MRLVRAWFDVGTYVVLCKCGLDSFEWLDVVSAAFRRLHLLRALGLLLPRLGSILEPTRDDFLVFVGMTHDQ